jgi:hypothetical protein
MWKDYLERNNEQIAKWNARAREVHEREFCNKAITIKQRVPEDFWFKPYTRKFSGEEFVEKYALKQYVSWSTTSDKCRTSYQPPDQKMKGTRKKLKVKKIIVLE